MRSLVKIAVAFALIVLPGQVFAQGRIWFSDGDTLEFESAYEISMIPARVKCSVHMPPGVCVEVRGRPRSIPYHELKTIQVFRTYSGTENTHGRPLTYLSGGCEIVTVAGERIQSEFKKMYYFMVSIKDGDGIVTKKEIRFQTPGSDRYVTGIEWFRTSSPFTSS